MSAVAEFEQLLTSAVRQFVEASVQIGGLLATLAEHVQQAFDQQQACLASIAQQQQVTDAMLAELLKPTAESVRKTIQFAEASLKSEPQTVFANHLQAVANSIAALGWIAVRAAPAQFVVESGVNCVEFYLNKILKDAPDEANKQWCRQLKKLWQELAEYVKANHRNGVSWASLNTQSAQTEASCKLQVSNDAKANVFAQLDQGLSITCNLKKVSDADRVCKNPALRVTGPVQRMQLHATAHKTLAVGCGTGLQTFELRNDKEWRIENQNGAVLQLDAAAVRRHHVMYVLRSENTVIQVPAKCNTIQIDSCRKIKLLVNEVIATVDIVNSLNVDLHVMVKCRLVNIDKTDGVQVYLLAKDKTAEAQQTLEEIEIVTSKASAVNICTPDTKADAVEGDYVETPIAEQFRTMKKKIEKKKGGTSQEVLVWKTEPVESVA